MPLTRSGHIPWFKTLQGLKENKILQMFISLAISACAPFTNLPSIIGLYRVKLEYKNK
jgi:hypothetical protein